MASDVSITKYSIAKNSNAYIADSNTSIHEHFYILVFYSHNSCSWELCWFWWCLSLDVSLIPRYSRSHSTQTCHYLRFVLTHSRRSRRVQESWRAFSNWFRRSALVGVRANTGLVLGFYIIFTILLYFVYRYNQNSTTKRKNTHITTYYVTLSRLSIRYGSPAPWLDSLLHWTPTKSGRPLGVGGVVGAHHSAASLSILYGFLIEVAQSF